MKLTPDYIRGLNIDELKRLKSYLETKLRMTDTIIGEQIVSVCFICETPEYAHNDIPDGWGYQGNFLLCREHIDKMVQKYVRDSVHIKGDELNG